MASQGNLKNQIAADQEVTWYQAVLNSIIDAVVITGEDGVIVAANPAVERLFDTVAAEIIGQPIRLLIPELDSGTDDKKQKISAPAGIDHEHFGVRKNGFIFPLRMDLSEFMHEGKRFYVTLMRDDTANKAAEEMQQETLMEAVRELEHEREESDKRRTEIRAIIDTSVDAIAFVQPDGTFDYVDNRFTEFFGIDESQITKRNWSEMIPMLGRIFKDPQVVYELLAGTAVDETLELREIVTQRWPQFRELELQSRPVLTRRGRHLGRLYVFRDVTHEREVDRMKTQFVSMVSHELRTPLTSIKGFTEMILDEDFGEINEEQREFLGIVESNADRLISLVNDLLDISRIESGRVQLKRELVDVAEIMTIVVATMEHLIEEKQQKLEVGVDQGLPLVELDRDRIIQVLTNLLSNAYKYTQAGGHIHLSVERTDGVVRFAVTDNGFGISEQDQQKLFTRFFRVDSELTREIGGTGLGLNIVKTIIEMHGGEVTLESELDVGSTFAFTIPLTVDEKQPAVREVIEEADVSLPGRKILVVEDEPDIALLIRSLLEKADYTVETIATGEEAWAYLQRTTDLPHLITLDIELPGMKGIELASKMAAEAALADIPILMISIYGDDPAAEKLAFVESLAKPIDRTQLLKKVSSMLDQADTGGKVLMIEDRFSQQEALTAALEEQGIEVLQAAEGEKGLQMAVEERPDLILLGRQLPDMDGTTILRSIKQSEETAAIPVIIASDEGYQLSERARALALGAADFVSGPFDLAILLEEIKMFIHDEEE
jgi:PAS domain S-box-containing protein